MLSEHERTIYGGAAAEGRTMLRTLRENAGISQMELAGRLTDAGIRTDQAHIQKIEAGTIKHPTAPTLDAILTLGFNVPYRVRIDVLAAFGYRLRWGLPSDEEGQLELAMNLDELAMTIWPAYLVDYSQRIWGWNRLFPRLLGNTADDPANAEYAGLTILDILLNPAVGTDRQIANAPAFVPVIVAWFKVMTKEYRRDPWFLHFMEKANTWPGFSALWERIPDESEISLERHVTVPVEIQVPGVDVSLLLRPVHVTVALDPRFAILHLIPLNAATQAVCTSWASEDTTT